APATVQRAHNVLHRAVGQAVRWGWLPLNPVGNATPPRRRHRELRPPTPAEVLRIIEAAEQVDPGLAVYLLIAAATGARRSEVIGLRWSDVDLDTCTIVISRGVVVGLDGLVEKDTKTHASRRIALDRSTVEVLRAQRSRAEQVAEACGIAL